MKKVMLRNLRGGYTAEGSSGVTMMESRSMAAILRRVVQRDARQLSQAGARSLLQLGFDDQDRRRMHELVVKNQSDALKSQEKVELDRYVQVGLMLDLLQAQARLKLKTKPISRRNG